MRAMILAGLLAALPAGAAPPRWVGAWASSQQVPEPNDTLPAADLRDATLRQVVTLSVPAARLRVRVSNAFGTAPLAIDAARVALGRAGSAATVAGSDRALTFAGQATVIVPAGADYWSDPVALDVPASGQVAVSLHLPEAPARQTGHPGSRATSYLVHGDRTAAPDLPGAQAVDHWYQLAGIVVEARADAAAVVTLGDSITDGHGATTNGDDRWPDDLARRLQADPAARRWSVLNHGIGGNRVLRDGTGPNALARFDRDVLGQPGVRAAIVLEGINDLGTLTREQPASAADHAALVAAITGAYAQMIDRAHAHGIRIFGGTITPDGGSAYYNPDAANEADRQAINRWIRAPGHFDAVIDFDAAVRDPADPSRLLPRHDSGDHLHPSPAGYRAMAAAVPLALFR